MQTSKIKAQAKLLKKELKISHCQALDLIVKQLGYRSWNHYCAQKEQK